MSKILLFSDIHIHSHKNSLKRLDDCIEALEWVCKVAKQHHINDVVFLGDLFQDRQRMQTLCYNKTYNVLREWAKELNFYLLLGNHDLWYNDKLSVSSVIPFGSIDNVVIIDSPRSINIQGLQMDFLPYTHNPIPTIESFLNNGPGRVLCGHIALHGAKLNKYATADVSVEHEGDIVKVDSNAFTGYEKVFLGHYHMSQEIGIVEYVGSPLQLNFGEAHEDKHVIILDTNTLDKEYISNDLSPKHYIIKEEELSGINTKNNYVRIDVDDLSSMAKAVDLKKDLLKEGALTVEFKKSPKKNNDLKEKVDITKDIFTTNQNDLVENFVKASVHSLKEDKLIHIGKQLLQDSKTE